MQENNIIKLLGIKDKLIKIENISETDNSLYVTLSRKKSFHKCPECSALTNRVHDYRPTSKIKHSIIHHKPVILLYKKCRYVCTNCAKRFTEPLSFVSKYAKVSNLLIQNVLKHCKQMISLTAISSLIGVSISTVSKRFNDYVDYSKPSELPTMLSIDEFASHTSLDKFATSLVDLSSGKPFDILYNRKKYDLMNYFFSFPYSQRKAVKLVVIDMSYNFRSVVKTCFPNATIIADKFHYVRYIIDAFNNIRIKSMKQFRRDSIEYRIIKRYWKHLNKRYDSLNSNHFYKDPTLKYHTTVKDIVDLSLSFSNDLKIAYELKEEFYNIIDYKNKRSFVQINSEFRSFIELVKESNLPQFKPVLSIFRNWYNEISNSLFIAKNDGTHYTNSTVEGLNNKYKVIKRIAFGYRNFSNFKRRILYISDVIKISA